MRITRLSAIAPLSFVLAFSLVPSVTFAATSVGSKTCGQLKSTLKSKGSAYYRTRRGTKRFAHSAYYCQQEEQLVWQIVQSRSGKCYLQICRAYLNFR